MMATIMAAVLTVSAQRQDPAILSKVFDSSYVYENSENYAQALSVLKKHYDAESYEINLRLGWLSYLAGSYSESVNYYQQAVNLKPYAIEPRLGYVLPASAMNNWNQVMDQYNKILSVDPMNTLANYRMGLIHYNRAQYDIALKFFEKVANLYPFDYDNTIMFAWTHFRLGNLREAKVLFQKLLLIQPGDTSAQEGLGLIK